MITRKIAPSPAVVPQSRKKFAKKEIGFKRRSPPASREVGRRVNRRRVKHETTRLFRRVAMNFTVNKVASTGGKKVEEDKGVARG